MDWLSDAASWITLLSFAILILSKIYLVRQTMGNIINDFTLDYLDTFDDERVYDEITVDENNEYNGPLGIISSMNLQTIKFVRINDDEGNPLNKPRTVAVYKNLPRNCLLQVNILIPEGCSFYKLVIVREDYVTLHKEVSYNGSGYKKYEKSKANVSWRTYLYYLLK